MSDMSEIAIRNLHASSLSKKAISEHAQEPTVLDKIDSDVKIGLEIHCELLTDSKLFCSCPANAEEPNTAVCPICLGHPGAKPVVNRKAVEHGLKTALALGCRISPRIVFSRKTYFYPDLAKNFQITQYEFPIGSGGSMQLYSGERIGIKRIHLEEDPAAIEHPENADYILMDYNRSGCPLIEVVTLPEIKTGADAREFLKQFTTLLTYLKVFHPDTCRLRVDANVSIKETNFTRTEIKNILGFKEVERAIEYETAWQRHTLPDVQHTKLWNAEKGATRVMRRKETEEDYGYIFEPDIAPIDTETMLKKISSSIPELPSEKFRRFLRQYSIAEDDAEVIVSEMELAGFFERTTKKVEPRLAAKWIRKELLRVLNYANQRIESVPQLEKSFCDLLKELESGRITEATAKKLLEQMIEKPIDVRAHIEAEKLRVMSGDIEKFCREAIEENPQAVSDYMKGRREALNFIVGHVMRKTKGRAGPLEVRKIIERILKTG